MKIRNILLSTALVLLPVMASADEKKGHEHKKGETTQHDCHAKGKTKHAHSDDAHKHDAKKEDGKKHVDCAKETEADHKH